MSVLGNSIKGRRQTTRQPLRAKSHFEHRLPIFMFLTIIIEGLLMLSRMNNFRSQKYIFVVGEKSGTGPGPVPRFRGLITQPRVV